MLADRSERVAIAPEPASPELLLQGHADSIVENLSVFKLSLQGTLRQERREKSGFITFGLFYP